MINDHYASVSKNTLFFENNAELHISVDLYFEDRDSFTFQILNSTKGSRIIFIHGSTSYPTVAESRPQMVTINLVHGRPDTESTDAERQLSRQELDDDPYRCAQRIVAGDVGFRAVKDDQCLSHSGSRYILRPSFNCMTIPTLSSFRRDMASPTRNRVRLHRG